MEKTGWQVTALLLGMGCIGLGLAVGANRAALAETERQLTNARNTRPAAPPVEVYRVEREPCPLTTSKSSERVRCMGGVVLERTSDGWNSVLQQGRAMTCQ